MFFTYALLLIPISLATGYLFEAPPLLSFVMAILAILPLAEWIRRATDQMAKLAGPAVGGLLNVTFGNLTELILALFLLADGKSEIVKAQITGSMIGNAFLGLGLAIFIGAWGRDKLEFNRRRAGLLSSLLMLAVVALLVPAMFAYTERDVFFEPNASAPDERLSLGVALVLIVVYLANLIYTLVTHRDVFAIEKHAEPATWSIRRALAVLVAATAATAVEAELVSAAIQPAAEQLGLTTFFLGVIVLAVIGNAAEYLAAVYFARQNRIGLAMVVTVGSTIQVALMTAPLLVLVSYFIGHPMNLVFANPLELVAIAAVAFVVNAIAHDGEVTWFEGAMLLSVYLILGLAFYFIRPESIPAGALPLVRP